MKQNFYLLLVNLYLLLAVSELNGQTTFTLKNVDFDFPNSTLWWNGQRNTVPCKEAFTFKIINIESTVASTVTATTVINATLTIYETTGGTKKNKSIVKDGSDIAATYTITGKGIAFNSITIKPLDFHRFYYFEVKIENAQAANSVVSKEIEVYSTAHNKDLVFYELFAAAGDVIFSDKERDLDHNLSIATGVKFNLRPTSSSGRYKRTELYPTASRWSLVIGAVLTPLTYKSTNVKPLFVLIKPTVGINYEITRLFGVSFGTTFGSQEIQSNLNGLPHIVAGFWGGISVSAEVFQAFRKSIPALNLPEGFSTDGQSK